MSQPTDLQPLLRLCREFRRRLARLLAVGGVSRWVCAAVGVFAALSIVDWWMHWGGWVRLVTLVGYGFILAYIANGIWRSLARSSWSDRDVLDYFSLTSPETSREWLVWYELITADKQIQELESPAGQQMAASATVRLAENVREPAWSQVFETLPVRRWLFAAVAALVVLAVCALLISPQLVQIAAVRLFVPFSTVRWPHRTTIAVAEPAHGWTVPQLEAFPVRATVSGDVPARITFAYRTDSNSTWTKDKLPVREDGSVAYTFPEVREPVEFFLEGGDYQTDRLRIDVVARPFLKSITAHYTYPTYARLPDRTAPGGQLAGLEGTKVRLELESSMPLDRAVLVLSRANESAERIELAKRTATQFVHEMMLTASGQYAVELYEPHGYREAKPEVYDVRVTPDDPPEVELLAPSQDLVETNQASIDVALAARDQLGLTRVEFLYQLGDQPPQPLTDVITGPIPQAGPQSAARFTWELRKLELPESAVLNCFVRVRDNNPTGRGVRDSLRRQIKLVRPSEFHLEAVEQAKLLEEEARIAWKNQLQAWELAARWKTEGSGLEGDPLWTEMYDAQQRAFQAARQVRVHLQTLTAKFERNHMGQDFMAGRLSVVAELLARLQDQEYAPIATSLADARPNTSADAAPDRLQALRSAAVGKSHDHQKLAVLILERMLRKLYDWRDLQTATITTKLLHEQQGEVLGRTEQVAPKTIAKEIEDLSDQDQDRLLTLGKQQRAIFDTETGLEQQLTYMMYKAERQARRSILDPLRVAFTNLRNNRVNDHLKQSADLIANNQPSQIINSQKAALRALQVVQAGLMAAGQKVDEEEPLTLAMTPLQAAQFDPDQIKPPELAAKDPQNTGESAPVETPTAVELPTLPEGSDALSAAVRLTIELEDNVLARTRYLDKNRGPGEMPRFVRLKLLRLAEGQADALAALDVAQRANADKRDPAKSSGDGQAPSPVVSEMLGLVREEFQQSQGLLQVAEIDGTAQQLQADAIETLRGVVQHVALAKAIDDATSENRRLKGLDGFGRPYLLSNQDLDLAIEIVGYLQHARGRQSHAQRIVERFVQFPANGMKAREVEKENRDRAAKSQRAAADLLSTVLKRTPQFSSALPERVRTVATAAWSSLRPDDLAVQISAGRSDAQLAPALRDATQQIEVALSAIRDLLEERIRPEVTTLAKSEDTPKMTLEEYERLTSPEHLAALLKTESSLPPELRELMARSLERDLPPKFRHLLTAYYASFIKPQEPATQNEESGK